MTPLFTQCAAKINGRQFLLTPNGVEMALAAARGTQAFGQVTLNIFNTVDAFADMLDWIGGNSVNVEIFKITENDLAPLLSFANARIVRPCTVSITQSMPTITATFSNEAR
jgi:hypothetical protein